ncbi:MAG TPA: hypothetical protein VMU92_05745 [Acidobacteriaceae bacterium]|nr:hypothetical protein [Acidobacteriaceae bacterium]
MTLPAVFGIHGCRRLGIFSRLCGSTRAPRIALMPIGADKPVSFQRVPMSPEDAARAFIDLRAERLIPMHYGTFPLFEEPMYEPLPRFFQAADNAGIRSAVDSLRDGETRILA